MADACAMATIIGVVVVTDGANVMTNGAAAMAMVPTRCPCLTPRSCRDAGGAKAMVAASAVTTAVAMR